ncbi:hypothetical protein ACHWQZ_G000615 [Mnemiopsis leidyi]
MDYTLFCLPWRVETVLHLTRKVVVDSHCNPSRVAGVVLHLTLSVSADNLYNPPRSTANSLLLSPEDARRTLTPAKRSHLCWPQSIVTVEGRLQCNMTETEQDLFTRISSSEVSVNTLCTEYQPLAIANHNSNPSLASRGECGSSRRRAGKVEENCGVAVKRNAAGSKPSGTTHSARSRAASNNSSATLSVPSQPNHDPTASSSGSQAPPARTCDNINFTQINLHKSKAALGDLTLFIKNKENPFILAQEPHVNGKNIISKVSRDMRTVSSSSTETRPRACIYHHKSLCDKLWILDSLNTRDCTVVQTKVDGRDTILASCYMDRNDELCPPQAFRDVVNYAKTHKLGLIAGSDVNAHNTAWNSRICDKKGSERGDKLLEYIVENQLFIENQGDTPTFDNGRWTNAIDLTITNQLGHDLVDRWNVEVTGDGRNSSDHNYITFRAKSDKTSSPNFKDISKTNWTVYEEKLELLMATNADKFSSIDSIDKLDEAADLLSKTVLEAFDSATELTYISSKIRPPAWDTPQVKEARKDMREKIREAIKRRDPHYDKVKVDSRKTYEKLRNQTWSSKFREFCSKLEAKSDTKRISSLIKNTKTTRLGTIRRSDGTLTESATETLEVMTQVHFGEHAEPPQVQNQPPVNPARAEAETEWDLNHIFSENRVRRALEEFSPLTAAGPDGIRPIMLQKGWAQVKTAFAEIAKASYALGHTPSSWCNATGVFLPKPGKSDYCNPKSFRTITLAPVPLKWMERIILWHLETDLDIYSKLSKKQYGFRRGCSTIAAVHKLVRKLEFAILNQGMALGTFLDIEGAFDNVSFDAIERALNLKCKSRGVNRWIMSMIRNRRILVGLQDEKRVILIRKGCPQGGILSPFLWNLVVNELLEYTWDKMPSDLQGFADDMSLVSIVTAPKRPNGKPGYDADTLREVTQKSLNSINAWCKRSGLKLSHLKSHCVMFTNRRNWSFDRPLKVDGAEIDVLGSTKFLGIILDSKLSWNEHIDNLCRKTKGILMQCRRVVGPTWGFKPATMRWVYDVMVKPILSYGATIWVNGTKTKHNQQLLSGVQRLANVIITGALPTTPGSALDVINGSPPLHLWLAEEAAKGALRLKNLGHWLPPPAGRANMRLTSHITTIENTLRSIPECKLERDETTPKLCIDQQFEIEIPTRESYHEKDYTEFGATCFTDGSKTSEGVGSGVVINATIGGETINHEESYHLNEHCTVFQAEVHAVGQAATYLLEKEVKGQSILINCDSQSAIRAINSTIIRNHTILETSRKLNALGKSNTVLLRWIPAHQGHEGNERADTLAKNGANMSDNPTMVKLPIPRGVCYAALRRKTIAEWRRNFKISPPKVFSTMWRDRFSKELPKLGKRDLRTATQILTGHACLNYHLSKINRDIAPTCSLCQEENETVEHVLAKCPKLWELRVEFFDSHFTTVRDIVDRHTLSHIVNFLHRTGQLKTLEAK